MIRRLKYEEIDFEKFRNCVDHSSQKNFYAQKEVLDFLTENWELLVWKNYEVVMPIPVQKKYSFTFVVMPLFCQQLGIFGNNSEEINQAFLQFLKKKYRIVNYQFNYQNRFSEKLPLKKNHIINTTEYPLLRKKYFKGRKSTVKSAQNLNYSEEKLTPEILNFIKLNFKGLDKISDQEKFSLYIKNLEKRGLLKLFSAKLNHEILSLAIITESNNEFSLLGLVNDKKSKDKNGASFLIDRILKENIHEKSFNFMGGNIRGQEVFFKSFGAELQEYPLIQDRWKDLILKIFIK